MGTLAMVAYTGYIWCLQMCTLAMVPSLTHHMGILALVPLHRYTGYGACKCVHWLWCVIVIAMEYDLQFWMLYGQLPQELRVSLAFS